MILPGVDARNYEMAAFTQLRGLRGIHAEWSKIISVAQAVIARAEDTPRDKASQLRATDAVDMLACCRALDAVRQGQSGLDVGERLLVALEAAVAYAMAANFPAAHTIVLQWLDEENTETDGDLRVRYAPILAAAAPLEIWRLLASVRDRLSANEHLFLESILVLLNNGGNERFRDAMARWEQVVRDSLDDTYKSSLLREVRIILYQIAELSVQNALKPFAEVLPNGYIESLCNSGYKLLLPSQQTALSAPGFLQSSDNVLISMPTSTGKTLLGQLCMCAALGKRNGLSCYVAPYQALANQVFRDFRRQLPRSIQVERAIGGYSPVEQISPEERAVFVVATPERFDAMIRTNPDLLAQLRCVVLDEAHMIEQSERGVRLEGLLTRLRLLQLRQKNPRLALLSPTLSDQARLEQWLSVPTTLSIQTSWRPTARRLALWRQPGILQYFYSEDALKPEVLEDSDPVAELAIRWPHADLQPSNYYGMIRKQSPNSLDNIAYLCSTLLQEFDEPILCVCSTRASTREVAYRVSNALSPVGLTETTLRLASELERNWPHLRLLRLCVEKGVAYHNASLPTQVRELIEAATEAGDLQVVTATTTLAEGVNLPFRFTVLVDWLAWTGEDQQHRFRHSCFATYLVDVEGPVRIQRETPLSMITPLAICSILVMTAPRRLSTT